MKSYVLWGTPTKESKYWSQDDQDRFGEQDEKIITEKQDMAIIKQAMEWAKENHFENLRVLTIEMGDKPDFTKGINI